MLSDVTTAALCVSKLTLFFVFKKKKRERRRKKKAACHVLSIHVAYIFYIARKEETTNLFECALLTLPAAL